MRDGDGRRAQGVAIMSGAPLWPEQAPVEAQTTAPVVLRLRLDSGGFLPTAVEPRPDSC